MGWILDSYEWNPRLGVLSISFDLIGDLGFTAGDLREIGETIAEALKKTGKIPKDATPVRIVPEKAKTMLYITVWSEAFSPVHPMETIPPIVFDFTKEEGAHFVAIVDEIKAVIARRKGEKKA